MTRLPAILSRDYLRQVVLPRLALAAALTIIANALIFATIVFE